MHRFRDKSNRLLSHPSPLQKKRGNSVRRQPPTDFFQQFPIEVLNVILELLPLHTLCECIQVNRHLCRLIVYHPKCLAILSEGISSQLDETVYKSEHLKLGEIIVQDAIFGYMGLVGQLEHLKGITLENIDFSRDQEGLQMRRLLVNARRGLLSDLTYANCTFAPAHARELFKAVAYVNRLAIKNVPMLNEDALPRRWLPVNPFKLTMLTFTCARDSGVACGWIVAVLKHCPYLEYLYLGDTFFLHGDWDMSLVMERASKASRHLKVIMWTPDASSSVPSDTLFRWPDQVEGDGLRYLVITGAGSWNRRNRLKTVLKRHHASLELLYLHYDHATVLPNALAGLGQAGAPQLREIRLSTEDRTGSGGRAGSIQWGLNNLFRGAPALEAVQIIDTFPNGHLRPSKDVLRALGALKHLKVLHITGKDVLLKQDLWAFCENGGGAALEILRLSFSYLRDVDILDFAKRLPSLKACYNGYRKRNLLRTPDTPPNA